MSVCAFVTARYDDTAINPSSVRNRCVYSSAATQHAFYAAAAWLLYCAREPGPALLRILVVACLLPVSLLASAQHEQRVTNRSIAALPLTMCWFVLYVAWQLQALLPESSRTNLGFCSIEGPIDATVSLQHALVSAAPVKHLLFSLLPLYPARHCIQYLQFQRPWVNAMSLWPFIALMMIATLIADTVLTQIMCAVGVVSTICTVWHAEGVRRQALRTL